MNMFSQVADNLMGQRETKVPTKPNLSSHKTMHALVWNGPNDIQYKMVPLPEITDPGDILLKVTATSICGSDIHLVDGSVPTMRSGDILGHEFMGIVEEVGDGVKTIKKGQRVVVAYDIACGDCEFCKREEFSACKATNPSNLMASVYGHRTSAMYGYSHLTGGIPGGQAEFVRVPLADVNCLPIPDEVSDEKALFLGDVVPTSFHAVKLGKVKEGDVVAIWGMGPVGLLTVKWCKLLGASRIIGIDCVPERLRRAREYGADTINYSEHNIVDTLKEIFPDGVDVAIECVGGEYSKTLVHRFERALQLETDSADIFTEMFQAVRPFGRVVVIGDYMGLANHFPVGAMMEKSLTVRGGQAPVQRYWKELLNRVMDGTIDPSALISHREELAKGPALYKTFISRKDGVMKVFMRPESTAGRVLE